MARVRLAQQAAGGMPEVFQRACLMSLDSRVLAKAVAVASNLNALNKRIMKKLLRNLRAAVIFQCALKAQQDGRYEKTLSLLEGFEFNAYFMAKAELIRAMAHDRLRRFAKAVAHYDVFLVSLVHDMPKMDPAHSHSASVGTR